MGDNSWFMLFNSYEFILLFLPVTLFIYFALNKQKFTIASKSWLVFASLFFYSWWNIKYLPLILCSILFNFSIGTALSRIDDNSNVVSKRAILIFGIIINLFLLAYYKYANFFITNIGTIMHKDFLHLNIILPLGISFFTFTQIAYIVDAYKGQVKETDYLNYSLFVTFFPHLIAGPILHHSEMMPQFNNVWAKVLNYKNISKGLFLFVIGLFKKVVIADTFAIWAINGFNNAHGLNLIEAWATSLSYTFQLYFDFSGYTDMALGAALMFNIILPINFNKPYIAQNIQDFWRRWHITLSRFLKNYIYIPFGGNRNGEYSTYSNLMATFLIGGLWHGASWTFVFWGFLHGAALIINKAWQKLNIKMNKFLAWFITFNFVNIAWIFFRAKSFSDAIAILKALFGFNGIALFSFLQNKLAFLSNYGIKFGNVLTDVNANESIFIWLILIWIVIFYKDSIKLAEEFKPNWKTAIFTMSLLLFFFYNSTKISEFLYFQF